MCGGGHTSCIRNNNKYCVSHIIGAVVYLSQQHRFEFMEFCFYLLSKTAK